MSKFMTALPKRSKSNGGKKKSLVMSLKPCADDKTYYRVRLLAFFPDPSTGSDRDDPFIERFVHQHWGVNKDKGYPVLEDEIVCPVTPHVHVEGNRYDACKICGLANKYFIAFKESGWKDKDANRKNKEFGRKYQAIIPVYVVNNPNWEGDNGKLKVMIFNDKKFYQEFRKKIERASEQAAAAGYTVFNGKNAVDCCIHVKEELENNYRKRVIDKVVFSTKPYDIESITKEKIDEMGFDDEYYQSSTLDEIDMFYKKYCTVSNDDIPEDDSIQVYDEPAAKPEHAAPVEVYNASAAPATEKIAVNDLLSDPDDLPAETAPVITSAASAGPAPAADDVDTKELLESLGI